MTTMKSLRLVCLSVACLLGSASITQAGIINGSFEDLGGQSFQNGTWGLFSSIPGWSAAPGGFPIEIGLGSIYGVTGYDQNNVLELDSTGNAVVSQIVATPGGSYDLSFLGARRNGVSAASTTFAVYWNGVLVANYAPTLTTMSTYSATVTALASNTLEFRGTGTQDSLGAIIDNVQLTSVPDAGVTGMLFGVALAGLGYFRKFAK